MPNITFLYESVNYSYMTKKKKYRNLSIPSEFIAVLEKFLKDHPELGFTSMSEFVKAAVRSFMRQQITLLEREGNNPKKKKEKD